MKTKYVLLTAVSALMVATGANAVTKVATQSYTDQNLAGKPITAPTSSEANKVVTVNESGNGFVYTTKDALPTNATAGQVLKWDATTSKWVAGTDNGDTLPTGTEGQVLKWDATTGEWVAGTDNGDTLPTGTEGQVLKWDATTGGWVAGTDNDTLLPDGTANGQILKWDSTTSSWELEADANTTYEEFDGTNVGLVPAADGLGETDMFLKGDGTWATPEQVAYDSGNGIALSDDNKFSVKAVTNGGITVTSDGVSVDKEAVLGGADETTGCQSSKCALVANRDTAGNITYTWEDLTEPYGDEE